MRILGIDPGLARVGWAVVDHDHETKSLTAIAFDCFETKKEVETSKRLAQIYDQIMMLIRIHEPDVLAIEQLFFAINAKTAFAVSQARGVILLAGAKKGIPNFVYTPLQVKMIVTGYGRAEKEEVGKRIKKLLKLTKVPKLDDTADALAVAIAHTLSNGVHTNKPYQKPVKKSKAKANGVKKVLPKLQPLSL